MPGFDYHMIRHSKTILMKFGYMKKERSGESVKIVQGAETPCISHNSMKLLSPASAHAVA
jgi:hypothetical protein